MIISDFTTDEINILLSRCNFTPMEKELFLLRSKGYTLDTISEKLIISRDWAGKLSQKVNKKIIRSLYYIFYTLRLHLICSLFCL